MQYYANDTAIGPRAAVAQVLGVTLDQVELGHDSTGFFLVRPEGATPDPVAVAAVSPPTPPDPTPVTELERSAGLLAGRRCLRSETLFSEKDGLVAQCYVWLKSPCTDSEGKPQQLSAGQALMAGQGLGGSAENGGYGAEMRGWVDLAAPDFRAKILADTSRDWLDWKPVGSEKTIRQGIVDRIDAATNPS